MTQTKGGKFYTNKPKMWVRPNSPYTGPLMDVLVFPCPMRLVYAIAVLDKNNNFWSAPAWTHGGRFWTERMDSMPREHILNEGMTVPDMLAEFDTLLQRVNSGVPGESAMLLNDSIFGVTHSILSLPEEHKDYSASYKAWEQEFDREIPRPNRSPLSAHYLSMRAARMTHIRRCKAVTNRMVMRDAKATAKANYEQAMAEYQHDQDEERRLRLQSYTAQDILG